MDQLKAALALRRAVAEAGEEGELALLLKVAEHTHAAFTSPSPLHAQFFVNASRASEALAALERFYGRGARG